ncbi:hypothetical protein [Pedobacter sp. MC2016-24]|uniref:hypothetical protein n=1 Tax=Pedobacter sp. MC2016-24 TaxID=2780090 RepID=UPI00187F2E6E|nr:hypothetical protein [Pedobacter sp. MC2016-24]MBE9599851.1 hypothetical protein [Pedobacter sp. MC2016-24]
MKNNFISSLKRVNSLKFIFFFLILLFFAAGANAQFRVKLQFGQIIKDDGTFGTFRPEKHKSLIDSLDKNLKSNPKDTTSLFYRAAIYLFSNDILSKPYQREKGSLEALVVAKNMAESAVALNMHDFRLKVLRAQIYKDLVYRYTGDESWMFKAPQIVERRKQHNSYKELANKYYDELAAMDEANAHEYQKLKVTHEYSL